MKLPVGIVSLCKVHWDLDQMTLTAFNGRFEASIEFFTDIEAYHKVTPTDILSWILYCDNMGRLDEDANIDLRVSSSPTWPKRTNLVFKMELLSEGRVVDFKYLSYDIPSST